MAEHKDSKVVGNRKMAAPSAEAADQRGRMADHRIGSKHAGKRAHRTKVCAENAGPNMDHEAALHLVKPVFLVGIKIILRHIANLKIPIETRVGKLTW